MTKKTPVVVLGVTGGIAAYKAAELCSLLAKKDLEVHVIMTENALRFVGELTFRTLSKNPVVRDKYLGNSFVLRKKDFMK